MTLVIVSIDYWSLIFKQARLQASAYRGWLVLPDDPPPAEAWARK